MGNLETKNKPNVRKTHLQEVVLSTLISGGRSKGNLVKSVLDAMLDTDLSDYGRSREVVRSAANRLTKNGLLAFKNGRFEITKTGQKILAEWEKSRYRIEQPRKWDGKWRVIIFDIPEKKKKVREKVREILLAAQFRRLQDSVWVYPHDCEDVIGLMKTDFGIGHNMLYMIVDQIENDRFLRMDFNLIK